MSILPDKKRENIIIIIVAVLAAITVPILGKYRGGRETSNVNIANVQGVIDQNKYPELKKALSKLVSSVETKDFEVLKQYTQNESKIKWIKCGPNNLNPIFHNRDTAIKMLNQDSRNNQIKVYKEPQVVDPNQDGKEYTTVIFTQGWKTPNSFRAFSFSSLDKKQWNLWSVCYDNEPPYDELIGHR